MNTCKFLLCGSDKAMLSMVKNTMTSAGHIFIGYSSKPEQIIRHVRGNSPELLILEVGGLFSKLRSTLEVMDSELLCATLLIADYASDEIYEFAQRSRTVTYLIKPVHQESLLQLIDVSLLSFGRVCRYEETVHKLNYALESRKVVEKAKWLLMQKKGCSEAEAYEILHKKSRSSRTSMKELAEALLLIEGPME